MYQQVISSETIPDYSSEAKVYLRLTEDVELQTIYRQLIVAIKRAEGICNRAFTKKTMLISSDIPSFNLLGVLDSSLTKTCKVDGVATTNYEITGTINPFIEFSEEGNIYQVEYYTIEDVPMMVKEWCFQMVNKLFNRNSPDITEPDNSLLEPYINHIWLY